MISIFFVIIIGIISLALGLGCKIFIASVKILSTVIGIYVGIMLFIALITSSIFLFIPIALVLLGVIIGKGVKK